MSDETSNVSAARLQPSASYSFTMRLMMSQQGGAFAGIARAIEETEAMLGAIDLVRVESGEVVRDVTVACVDSAHSEAVVRAVRELKGVRVGSVSDRTFLMHKGAKSRSTRKSRSRPATISRWRTRPGWRASRWRSTMIRPRRGR